MSDLPPEPNARPKDYRIASMLTGLRGRGAWLMIGLWIALGAVAFGFNESSPQFVIMLLIQWCVYRGLMFSRSGGQKPSAVRMASAVATGFLVGAFVFVRFYMGSTLYQRIETPIWEQRTMRKAIRELSAVTRPEMLATKVERGRLFTFPDGSWLALRYRDTHAFHFGSSGVSRDSDGRWLMGNHHFCAVLLDGNFRRQVDHQRRWREELAKASDPERKEFYQDIIESSAREAGLLKLDEAMNATAARQVLMRDFGFREIAAP